MREFWREIGYEPCTTFWEDFSMADKFVGYIDRNPLEELYDIALPYAKSDYKVFTELVMVLNHKIWQWYQENQVHARLYDALWRRSMEDFFKTFKHNSVAVEYYYRVTD